MKLEEAIYLSKAAADDMELQDMPRFAEAVRLGREALKLTKRLRKEQGNEYLLLLPGETEE